MYSVLLVEDEEIIRKGIRNSMGRQATARRGSGSLKSCGRTLLLRTSICL